MIDNSPFGILSSHITFGSRDKNVSIGVLSGVNGFEEIIFNISGMFKISDSLHLISENHITTDEFETTILTSFGVRFSKEVIWDVGIYAVPAFGAIILIPQISVTVPFGRYN